MRYKTGVARIRKVFTFLPILVKGKFSWMKPTIVKENEFIRERISGIPNYKPIRFEWDIEEIINYIDEVKISNKDTYEEEFKYGLKLVVSTSIFLLLSLSTWTIVIYNLTF